MPYGMDDVVAHVRLRLPAFSLTEVLHRCWSLIEELPAVGMEAAPIAPDTYLVKLVLVEESREEESSVDALRRVAIPLLARLDLGEEYFELDESQRKALGASVYYPEYAAKLVEGCEQVTIGVWMGDSVDDFYDTVESLDVDEDGEEQPQLDEADLVELGQILEQMHATKVLLVADIVAGDGIAARDHIRSLVERVCSEPLVGEPLPGPDGSIRVEVMVGMSDDGPDETYREVVDKLEVPGWDVVERTPELVRAVWSSPQPAAGVARMELRIGPDVGLSPEPAPSS